VTTRDHNPQPQARFSSEQKGQHHPSEAERLARGVIEQRAVRRLSDGEWAERRRRLIEFILILAGWDIDQRHAVELKNIDAGPKLIGLASRDKEECNTIKQPGA
jgi:hypothetical protein